MHVACLKERCTKQCVAQNCQAGAILQCTSSGLFDTHAYAILITPFTQMGVVALPLQELVRSAPTYFRCPDSGKTFASLAAYTAHAKAQQQQQQQLRSGDSSSKRSSTIAVPPVQIRTYDSYLTVASADAEAYVKVSQCTA
jgi:hypothetical protein